MKYRANIIIFTGLLETFFAIGYEVGAVIMGTLFNAVGTQKTLVIFSVTSATMFTILFSYVRFSKRVKHYEKLPQNCEDEE